jgi:OHCU decarboxylase
MRSDPRDYELVAPGSLQAAVALLARSPGEWLPIAGGTDIMVQYAAGKLPSRKLVSIWNLTELRRIEVIPNEVRIGAGCTYADIREHAVLGREFPMLVSAAGWTGGIANQNRGTLGGNIVNASPAADSLPALLAYDAELILISARGERRVSYAGFHTDYKKTRLAPDELIQSVCLPRGFSGYVQHARKVGSRNAQAISKVCIAALGRIVDRTLEDLHIALGSVAPVPLRLSETELVMKGKTIDESLMSLARETAVKEIRPIDDIRSTARYRAAVAGNLVAEFLSLLSANERKSEVLTRWNEAPREAAATQILPCCGSKSWAAEMAAKRPVQDERALMAASDEVWRNLNESDWIEAFNSHPRIGESNAPATSAQPSSAWAMQEQKNVADAGDAVKIALAEGNREYEKKFGRIFIVCATGKSAAELLEILRRRLQNDDATELHEAAEQQRQITQIRLRKWLQG